MSVGRMLLLMGASFLLPVALSSALLMRNLRHDIGIAQLEIAGLRYQRPLVAVLIQLAEFAELAREHSPGAAALAAPMGAVDASFAEARSVDAELRDRLHTTPERLAAGTRRARAGELRASRAKSAPSLPTARRASRALETDVLALIGHVGGSSTLILDPDSTPTT
jgi:hypothetical protein